jgi:penicillin-binding protein 1C
MSEVTPHTQSSCPGKSARRVFAQMSRASTDLVAASKNVDGRDRPGHDGAKGRGFRVLSAAALMLILAISGFVAWVYSLGPLPFDEARQVSTTIVDRNGALLRA